MPSFSDLTLQTARLDLRPLALADAQAERWIVGGEKCDSLIYGLLAGAHPRG